MSLKGRIDDNNLQSGNLANARIQREIDGNFYIIFPDGSKEQVVGQASGLPVEEKTDGIIFSSANKIQDLPTDKIFSVTNPPKASRAVKMCLDAQSSPDGGVETFYSTVVIVGDYRSDFLFIDGSSVNPAGQSPSGPIIIPNGKKLSLFLINCAQVVLSVRVDTGGYLSISGINSNITSFVNANIVCNGGEIDISNINFKYFISISGGGWAVRNEGGLVKINNCRFYQDFLTPNPSNSNNYPIYCKTTTVDTKTIINNCSGRIQGGFILESHASTDGLKAIDTHINGVDIIGGDTFNEVLVTPNPSGSIRRLFELKNSRFSTSGFYGMIVRINGIISNCLIESTNALGQAITITMNPRSSIYGLTSMSYYKGTGTRITGCVFIGNVSGTLQNDPNHNTSQEGKICIVDNVFYGANLIDATSNPSYRILKNYNQA